MKLRASDKLGQMLWLLLLSGPKIWELNDLKTVLTFPHRCSQTGHPLYFVYVFIFRSFKSSKVSSNINSISSNDVKIRKNTRSTSSNPLISFSNTVTYTKGSGKLSNNINSFQNSKITKKQYYTLNYLGSFKENNGVKGDLYSR